MALSNLLIAMANISVAANMAAINNVGFDERMSAVPKLESVVYTPVIQKETRTSVHFRSAKVSEVLNWLQNNGYSFVINDGDIGQGRTITLSISNQPVSTIADAIAAALGGHWDHIVAIHVFKKGTGNLALQAPWQALSGSNYAWGDGAPMAPMAPDKDFEKLFGQNLQNPKGDPFGSELSKNLQNQFGPEFQKKMQDQFGPEFQKKMMDQFGPDFQKKLMEKIGPELKKNKQDQFGPEFQKKMEDQFGPKFQKQMEDQFGPKFQKQMEEQFGPEFQKKMEDQFGPKFQKQMEDEFGPKFQKQMEDQFGPKFQKQMEEMGKQFEKEAQKNKSQMDWSKGSDWAPKLKQNDFFAQSNPFGSRSGHSSISFGKSKLDPVKLLKSLSAAQKDEQKKQGYIWFNDLSREQKAMFEDMSGEFDFQVKINGEEVRIRGN